MQSFYILCLAAAFSLFLWQSVSDARQSVVQQTMLLVIIISNGGYAALAGAENLREAVLATKVLYTGACFLPMLYFITMCEVCRVHLSRFLLAGMTLLQTLLFGFVCTIRYNNLFYKANNAHGKYLLFKIFRESIINGGGECVSLAGIFFGNRCDFVRHRWR